MKKSLLLGLILVLSAGLLFAGGGREEQYQEPTESRFEGLFEVNREGWEIGTYGGQVVVASLSDPKTFNIITGSETSTTDITSRMFDGLVDRNQHTLEWEPELAESWEIGADQQSITLKLREGLVWSDGDDITAEDFVWAVNEVFLNDLVESNYTSGLYVGDEPSQWEVVDDLTIRVTLPSVYAGILNLVSQPPLPIHILQPFVAENGIEALNSLWGLDSDPTEIPVCGPFKVKEYVPSQKVVMERNDRYWRTDAEGNRLPYLDEVVFSIIPDQDTMREVFRAGDLTALGLRGEDVAPFRQEKEAGGDFDMYAVGPVASTQFITFNMNYEVLPEPQVTWLSNKKFRLAMAHLVDRQAIINNVAYGFGQPQYSFIPRFSPYYWDGADDAAAKYDPEAAKALLDEIGYVDTDGDGWREDPDGNKIALVLNTNSGNTTREAIGELFSQEAQKVGIDITFKPEDFNALVTKLLSTFDWELILIGLTGSVDPISGQNVYPSSGNLHMVHPNQESPIRDWEKAVDAAWEEANLTTDENDRVSGFEKIQRIWIEENPWVYTFNAIAVGAVRKNVGNYRPQPVDGYEFIDTLEYVYFREE
jgi:peptide/nickel transport system substrate-binding protein